MPKYTDKEIANINRGNLVMRYGETAVNEMEQKQKEFEEKHNIKMPLKQFAPEDNFDNA